MQSQSNAICLNANLPERKSAWENLPNADLPAREAAYMQAF